MYDFARKYKFYVLENTIFLPTAWKNGCRKNSRKKTLIFNTETYCAQFYISQKYLQIYMPIYKFIYI